MSNVGLLGGLPTEFPRAYVAKETEFADWPTAESYYRELLGRNVGSAAQLERWLYDASELEACLDEERCARYVEATRQTDDESRQHATIQFVEQVEARQEALGKTTARRRWICRSISAAPAALRGPAAPPRQSHRAVSGEKSRC